MTPDNINNRFSYHKPDTAEKQELHELIRSKCKELGHLLNDSLPACRESSLAITNLEQTMFWANAAVARPKE